jgi:hypothetical protein
MRIMVASYGADLLILDDLMKAADARGSALWPEAEGARAEAPLACRHGSDRAQRTGSLIVERAGAGGCG